MAFEYVQMVPKWLFHHQSSVYCVVVLVETALPIRLVAYLKMSPTKLFINTTIVTVKKSDLVAFIVYIKD